MNVTSSTSAANTSSSSSSSSSEAGSENIGVMTSSTDVVSLIQEEDDNNVTMTSHQENQQLEEMLESGGGGSCANHVTIKELRRDKLLMLSYLIKPILMSVFASLLSIVGIVLTVYHFMSEKVIDENGKEVLDKYLTYGPIVFASGIVTFIFGIVWFSIKHNKWIDGTASLLISAATKPPVF